MSLIVNPLEFFLSDGAMEEQPQTFDMSKLIFFFCSVSAKSVISKCFWNYNFWKFDHRFPVPQ